MLELPTLNHPLGMGSRRLTETIIQLQLACPGQFAAFVRRFQEFVFSSGVFARKRCVRQVGAGWVC